MGESSDPGARLPRFEMKKKPPITTTVAMTPGTSHFPHPLAEMEGPRDRMVGRRLLESRSSKRTRADVSIRSFVLDNFSSSEALSLS